MRRMYSEQELTKVIQEVFEAELESGALDSKVSDAVDAYLVEHPVDITALEGQDIAPDDVNATGEITAPSIVESMSGYTYTAGSSTEKTTIEQVYAGVVKNGNKITFVVAVNVTQLEASGNQSLGTFFIPNAIWNKLYPVTIGGYDYLAYSKATAVGASLNSAEITYQVYKGSGNRVEFVFDNTALTANEKSYLRLEVTFLLSDNLAE